MTKQWIEALPESDLPNGTRKTVNLDGLTVLLLWHEDKLHAVNNRCPHLGYPLQAGNISSGELHCPFHRSAFVLETGDVAAWSPWPPGLGILAGKLSPQRALEIYDTKIEDGKIFVSTEQANQEEQTG